MADEEKQETEEKSRSGMLIPILIGVVGLLLGTVGAGGAVFFYMQGQVNAARAEGAAGGTGAEMPSDNGTLIGSSAEVIQLGQFTVNLRDSAGGRLLQMELAVEANGDAARLVEDREAQLRDAVLMLASDYSYLELEGLEGKLRLRDEIHRRVNTVLNPEKVERVYFTSFVVQ